MKFLATVILSMSASFAFAQGDSTINWPSVNGLLINNACATDTTFRSLKPVKTCTATETKRYAASFQGEAGYVRRELAPGESPRRNEWLEEVSRCVAYGKQDLEVSRTITYSECAYPPANGEIYEPCKKFVTKTKLAGLKYRVEKITHYAEADVQSFFNFRVPLCK